MTRPDLGVVMAAIVTPMGPDESVNTDALAHLVDHYVDRGVEGIYCNGSSGEGLLLSPEERAEVTRTAVAAAAGRVPVIAHIGTLRTQEAVELGRAALGDGATAVSMIPPIYYPYPAQAIIDHYRAVMDAVDLPMILYNVPALTGHEFTEHSAGALLSDPRVAGVKQTAHNMYTLEQMRATYPDKIYFNGFDEVFLSALAAGARGTIGTTVGLQPRQFLTLRDKFNAGDLDGARTIQSRINAVVREIVDVGVFPAAKYLAGRGIGDMGPCRRPLPRLSSDDLARLDALAELIDHQDELTRQEA
ncbi:dihydrodipicolinate synthase family protein [Ruania rhizosphaerae]|uniref:dihydrodipicolinate synthase family protein n=1 Tax=Ruania rhizosphaerae TaxID=1840413 RepID=UPI001357EE84|nr:dihydrodipicolinate synthase family protein [Ruania rhizosphaerae]